MAGPHRQKLDRLARGEKLRQLVIVLGVPAAVLCGLVGWVLWINGPSDPFATHYFEAILVQKTDVSSGTGLAFEVVVRFDGVQKAFQTDDPLIIDQLERLICVEETRGAPIGEDIPRPRYHRLVHPQSCETSAS